MIKRLLLSSCIVLLTGCASAVVKMQFSSQAEVNAYKQAEWVVYANNQQGLPVMFAPYQVRYSNPNNFTVPISLPAGGADNYGNWIWQFNCGSLNGRIISTLGGVPQNSSRDYPDSSLAGLIRSKLCGFNLKGQTYKFLSVGGQNVEVTNIQQNSLKPEIYKVDVAYKKPSESFNFAKIEVDCRRSEFRNEGETEWKSYVRRSPLDILRIRVCNTPQLKPYQLIKYSDEVKANSVQIAPKTQLRKKEDFDKPSEVVNDSASQKCKRIGLKVGTDDFDLCVQSMSR